MAQLIAIRRYCPIFEPPDEGDDAPMTQNPASEALAEALQNKLKALCELPLSARSLFEIEQTAQLARQLISLGKPGAVPRSRNVGAYINMPMTDEINDPDGVPLASSPRAETFGATVIREAASAYAEIMSRPRPTPPHEFIMAIEYARGHDMHDLAKRLEQQLEESLAPKPPPELPAPAPVHAVHASPPPEATMIGFACTADEMTLGEEVSP